MTTRRSFLGSILAAGMAPAIVKAEILMPVRKIIVPPTLITGEIGHYYGIPIVSTDHIVDAQRYLNQAFRGTISRPVPASVGGMSPVQSVMDLHRNRPAFISQSQYEQLLKGRA